MRFAEFRCLETDRLNLRRLQMEDIYEYYERLFGDGDVVRFLPIDPHQDISESLAELERQIDRYEEGDYCWAVAEKDDDSLIGLVKLNRFDERNGSCSFLCMLGCDFWNRGYGTEVLKAVMDFAFRELDADRIVADHMEKNLAAGAVMRKAGMTHIATEEGKYTRLGMVQNGEVYEIRNPDRKSMTANEYQKLAMTTLNPALDKKAVLINGVMGLCGESGEAIDIVKKWLAQGHELDRDALAKELGDIAWYLAETAYALDIPLEQIFRGNIEKLKKRYPEGFAAERSIHR